MSSTQQKQAVIIAQLLVEACTLMGYDAVGIGENDLRLGTKDFTTVKKMAGFPFISANVVTQRGREISAPSVVKEAGGLRWGIFSLMSDKPSLNPQNRDWKVLDPVSTGKQVVEELQGKVDIIVLLAAMPLQELKALLPQVPGITIAVAGNNPSGLRRPLQVGQTVVVSNYSYGRYLGVLTLYISDPTAPFVDEARIIQLERELAREGGKMTRKPVVAGQFYPASPSQLRETIAGMVDEKADKEEVIGMGCHQADYLYLGGLVGPLPGEN